MHFRISHIRGILRIATASFFGTILEVAGLLFGSSYTIFLAVVHLLEIPLMMCLVLGKERRQMFRVIVSGYFFVMLVNGVLEVLWNWFGASELYVLLLCAACLIVCMGTHIWNDQQKRKKGIVPVELLHGERSIVSYGFYDSGNHLKDPYTGKGVHIISEKLLVQLSLQEQNAVYIPYQSLGNEQGLLPVYYLENIRIQKDQTLIDQTSAPVGVAESTLFQNKGYQIILNEEIW